MSDPFEVDRQTEVIRRQIEEEECPCEDAGRVECCLCQDLPVGYFDKPHSSEKSTSEEES